MNRGTILKTALVCGLLLAGFSLYQGFSGGLASFFFKQGKDQLDQGDVASGLDIARWYGSKEGLVVAMALLGLPGVRLKR